MEENQSKKDPVRWEEMDEGTQLVAKEKTN